MNTDQTNYRDMVPFYHNHGGDSCGEVAFYVNRIAAVPGSPVHVEDVEFNDGSSPEPGSAQLCQNCRTFVRLSVEDIGGKAK